MGSEADAMAAKREATLRLAREMNAAMADDFVRTAEAGKPFNPLTWMLGRDLPTKYPAGPGYYVSPRPAAPAPAPAPA